MSWTKLANEHIVAGLIKALSILDKVIAKSVAVKIKDAKKNLVSDYAFTEERKQSFFTAIPLTNTDITDLQEEAKTLEQQIAELLNILNNEKNYSQS